MIGKLILDLLVTAVLPALQKEIVATFRKLESDENFKKRAYEVLDQSEKALTPNDDAEARRNLARLLTELKQR